MYTAEQWIEEFQSTDGHNLDLLNQLSSHEFKILFNTVTLMKRQIDDYVVVTNKLTQGSKVTRRLEK